MNTDDSSDFSTNSDGMKKLPPKLTNSHLPGTCHITRDKNPFPGEYDNFDDFSYEDADDDDYNSYNFWNNMKRKLVNILLN